MKNFRLKCHVFWNVSFKFFSNVRKKYVKYIFDRFQKYLIDANKKQNYICHTSNFIYHILNQLRHFEIEIAGRLNQHILLLFSQSLPINFHSIHNFISIASNETLISWKCWKIHEFLFNPLARLKTSSIACSLWFVCTTNIRKNASAIHK